MGIDQIQQTKAQWEADRPAGVSNFLYLKGGDIAFAHFIGSGQPDDNLLEVYLAHEVPGTRQFPDIVYCPRLSRHEPDYPCQHCENGAKVKERMMMWFFVHHILYGAPPTDPAQAAQQQSVDYQGGVYWHRAVERPMLWETSAWRESPLDDIIFTYGQLGNRLDSKQMILRCSGTGMGKRFKLTVDYQSAPFDRQAMSAEHQQLVQPVRALLRESIRTVELVERPATVPFSPNATPPQFVPGGVAANPPAALPFQQTTIVGVPAPFQPAQDLSAPAAAQPLSPFVPAPAVANAKKAI